MDVLMMLRSICVEPKEEMTMILYRISFVDACLDTWDEINVRARALLEGQGSNVPDNNEEVPPNGQPESASEGLRHRYASLPEEAQQILDAFLRALNMRPHNLYKEGYIDHILKV